ncbi:MAG: dTDP-4-dehydrorhamnose reductase [Clostridia bacterium]|nr:dTDP-4-dehydrorhamnose reductase [Clostridia bacterium]
MRVLVTGVNGQLGWEVVQLLNQRGVPCKGVDVQDFDLTDGPAVKACVQEYAPDVVVHCAAYTAVDKAESEPEVCAAVNGDGTMNMVRAALSVGAKMVYISTDYVFSGKGEEPWTEDAPYDPQNVYGLSKVQGEIAVRSLMKRYFLLRTSWVYGIHGKNFVRTMLRLGAEKSEIRVVDDQIGSPTYAADLARVICDLIPTEKFGIYHVANEGYMSWAHFARLILAGQGLKCRVIPVPSSDYPTPAHRPLNSRLSSQKLREAGVAPMPTVENALGRFMQELALEKMEQ